MLNQKIPAQIGTRIIPTTKYPNKNSSDFNNGI